MTGPDQRLGAAADAITFSGTVRFRTVACLGRGSIGAVYRVYDRETDSEVALKTLGAPAPEQLYHLKQEFRALAGIVHPNLVELCELVVTDRECFFTMELVDGVEFVAHVRREAGRLSGGPLIGDGLRPFLDAARQLVQGLAAVHSAGKLHRDVKPPNILITQEGRVVLLDFGLATALHRTGPADADVNGFNGTLAYMAPEQAWGKPPHPAADWYSVGVVFYEALAGRLPFGGSPARLLMSKARSAPPGVRTLVPALPERLEALITALLNPDASRRPSAREILAALDGSSCTLHLSSESTGECAAGASTHSARAVGISLPGEPSASRAFVERSAARASNASDVPFVGRTAELAKLHTALERVRGGQAAVVHILGPSGIGKSELVRRFLAAIEQGRHALILRGRCQPQESLSYNAVDAVIDALSRWLVSLPQAEVQPLIPQHADALTRLFPVLGRVVALERSAPQEGAAEPREMRRRGVSALRALLGRLVDRQPLILWIDDLQWSDADSAALLRELLRPPDAPAMLVLLSYRSEDRDHIRLLRKAEARADETALMPDEEIVLGPLDASEAHELAARLCAAQIESDRCLTEIVAESAGNPFFIGELARSVGARSHLAGDAPATGSLRLADVMAERTQQLSAPARQLLEVVSIAGGPVQRSIALAAAAVGERGRRLVAALEQRSLLRTITLKDQVAVEVYHDRIREALVASLATDVRQARHGGLADVLGKQPVLDAEALFRHNLGAGRRGRAAEWAVQAAERAAETLAFARAAELYGRALELKEWDEARVAALKIGRAEALVNAGRGAEAAAVFLSAAAHVPSSEQLDLRRRAAEQYLLTGHIDEGTAVIRGVLGDIGLRYPQTFSALAVGLSAHLIPLWLRGARIPNRAAANTAAEAAVRMEACHSAAKGLALVDPIRGLYFAVLSLWLALRSGDRERVALAFASAGIALLPIGGALGRLAARLINSAREIAATTTNHYLRDFTVISMAQVRMLEGRWREMLALCDAGRDALREHCRGVTWEVDGAYAGSFRALEEIGEIKAMGRRADELLRQAEQRGDLYGVVTALLNQALYRLLKRDPVGVRGLARRILASWTPAGFNIQHFYVFRLEAYCDICEGRPSEAWRRIQNTWPKLQRSNLLRHALLRNDSQLLRARTALAVACRDSADRSAMSACAERDAARFARESRPDMNAHALLIRAGTAALRGDRQKAIRQLTEAARRFEAAGMQLLLALTRRRTGELIGGETGRQLLAQTDEYFQREGITDPQAPLAMYAPGFD